MNGDSDISKFISEFGPRNLVDSKWTDEAMELRATPASEVRFLLEFAC